MKNSVLAATLSSAVIVLAGCSSQQLTLTDPSATTVGARAAFRFRPGGNAGLEVDVQRVSGSGSQSLDAVSTATLGGRSVAGPVLLQHSATVNGGHVAYHHRLFVDRPAQLEWFAGIGATRIDWKSVPDAPGAPTLERRANWSGPVGGIGGRWRFADSWLVEARTWAMTDRSLFDDSSRSAVEVALAFRPQQALLLRLGYANSETTLRKATEDSRIVFRSRGPFLALGLDFD